ncbi:MAG: sensor histidine kinase [Rhodocyclaceae bacterium]|nr:sensor histidine kinase [Rhodocyclaceae bacterium]
MTQRLQPAVDLKRQLALRVTVFALLICVGATAAIFVQAERRIASHVARSGQTLERLLGMELAQRRDFVARGVGDLQLALLEQMGESLRLCVRVADLTGHETARRCFSQAIPSLAPVEWLLARLGGAEVAYRGLVGQFPGIKVGEFVVTPDLRAEAATVALELRLVVLVTVGVLLLNALVYWPVRRALAPAEQVLDVIDRWRGGDLAARMPRPRLAELRRIAEGFDELAARLAQTDRRQKRLARRLLEVREAERRRLARELHDEFGQSLASVRAEAAFGIEAAAGMPALLPPLEAIGRTAGEMMENLQRILQQLRPVGLETFGLQASLEQLAADARRQRPGCEVSLELPADIDTLEAPLTVAVYRVVQESLTNALRHGEPGEIAVRVVPGEGGVEVVIDDDGAGDGQGTSGTGMGVLGMRERVEALGGRLRLAPRPPRGTRVRAWMPLPVAGEDRIDGVEDGSDTPDAGR